MSTCLLLLGLSPRSAQTYASFYQRAVIIIGVLAASVYVGYKPVQNTLLILLGAVAVLVFMRHPSLGPPSLIVASLVVPFTIGTGTQTEINAAVILTALLVGLWGLDMVRRRDVRLLSSRATLPLLLLVLIATVSFAVGAKPWLLFAGTASLPSQLGGLAIFILSVGAFLLVAHHVQDLRSLEHLTWLFLGLGAVYLAWRLIPGLQGLLPSPFTGGMSGSLFWTWLVALAFSQAAFNRDLRLPWRLVLASIVTAALYVGFVQARDWASGWMPPVVAILATIAAAAAPFGVVALVATGGLMRLESLPATQLAAEQYSLTTRVEAWRIMLEIIKINPILGLGPANYYWYTPLFPILGYSVKFNSHNNYVDILAQTGLLGIACFLWFVVAVGWLGWRLRRRVPDGFAKAYVYGALGGLGGTLVAAALGDWFLPFVYNIGLRGFQASGLGWIFLGGLVAIERMTPQGEDMNKGN